MGAVRRKCLGWEQLKVMALQWPLFLELGVGNESKFPVPGGLDPCGESREEKGEHEWQELWDVSVCFHLCLLWRKFCPPRKCQLWLSGRMGLSRL